MEEREEQRAREEADRMEDRAEDMEERSKRLDEEIRTARSDWESKKQDESAPGAQEEAGVGNTDPDELRERRADDTGEGSAGSDDAESS